MSLLIRGGRVLDPSQNLDQECDIFIEQGRITRLQQGLTAPAGTQEIDARHHLIVPGLIDMHVHLREPGEEYKEDISSGTTAAAAGGFTTVCCMPNTKPTNDTRAVTEFIVKRAAQAGKVRVRPIGAITKNLEGKQLCEYADMKEAGIVAVSDDGRCVMDAGLMRRALEYSATFNLPVIQHCEDHNLSAGGAMNEGRHSTRAGLSRQPAAAESTIVARDIELVRMTGAHYHVAHVSTADSLAHISAAKKDGLLISCEVTPHHLLLTDEACLSYDTNTKVNPPLRSQSDVQKLKDALSSGLIDVIATDHAPHSVLEKELEYGLAAFGMIGLETALPLMLQLWREKVVDLAHLIAMMTCNPARILGLEEGTLKIGALADLTIIDLDEQWVIQPACFYSRARNTPFAGRTVRGKVKTTIVGGQIVFPSEDMQ